MRYPCAVEMAWLALAAWRLWRLAAYDDILNGPRDRLLHRRARLAAFVECGWCLGFWIGVLCWTAWWWWPNATLAALTPFVLSALIGLFMLIAPD